MIVLPVSFKVAATVRLCLSAAQSNSAPNALADSEGHVLRIFMIFVLAGLPFAVLAVAITIFLGRSVAVPGTPAAVVGLAVGAVIQTAILISFVAIASRLFQMLASRVAGKSETKPS
jgi:hypothetical protein